MNEEKVEEFKAIFELTKFQYVHKDCIRVDVPHDVWVHLYSLCNYNSAPPFPFTIHRHSDFDNALFNLEL